MVQLPINHYHKKRQQGLTLIEVLIALAIVAIALTAIIKAASQNIRATTYLQEKTIATWVGQQVLNEARVGARRLPADDEKLRESTKMFGREWFWYAKRSATPNMHIKKMEVNVFTNDNVDDDDISPIVNLETYVYVSE